MELISLIASGIFLFTLFMCAIAIGIIYAAMLRNNTAETIIFTVLAWSAYYVIKNGLLWF